MIDQSIQIDLRTLRFTYDLTPYCFYNKRNAIAREMHYGELCCALGSHNIYTLFDDTCYIYIFNETNYSITVEILMLLLLLLLLLLQLHKHFIDFQLENIHTANLKHQ